MNRGEEKVRVHMNTASCDCSRDSNVQYTESESSHLYAHVQTSHLSRRPVMKFMKLSLPEVDIF